MLKWAVYEMPNKHFSRGQTRYLKFIFFHRSQFCIPCPDSDTNSHNVIIMLCYSPSSLCHGTIRTVIGASIPLCPCSNIFVTASINVHDALQSNISDKPDPCSKEFTSSIPILKPRLEFKDEQPHGRYLGLSPEPVIASGTCVLLKAL